MYNELMASITKLTKLPKTIKEMRAVLDALDVKKLNQEVQAELQTYVAIVGTVNTGKSTLLNYLIGKSVSKVSAVPGTTRTNIQRRVGPFELVDTPGFGDAAQPTRADVARASNQQAATDWLATDTANGNRPEEPDLFNVMKAT